MTVNTIALVVALRHLGRHRPLPRGRGALRPDRLCRHRRLLQIPPAGEHHRMTHAPARTRPLRHPCRRRHLRPGRQLWPAAPAPARCSACTRRPRPPPSASARPSSSRRSTCCRRGSISWQELLITLFLLLTAPISALFLAKTLILRDEADPTPARDRHRRPGPPGRRTHRPLIPRLLTIRSEIRQPRPLPPAPPHGIVTSIRPLRRRTP